MLKIGTRILAILTPLVIIGAWWYLVGVIETNTPFNSGLNYYGADSTHSEQYKVSDFSYINQYQDTISRAKFENKIWVTDFFFTTCDGICPIMNANLKLVHDTFIDNPNILFLSHTVDPETDTYELLKKYADRHGAKKDKWDFVTGASEDIYKAARTSYFVATPRDTSMKEDFVHSQLLCLVDPHLHIRGYYDGTNGKDMIKLIRDIRLLIKEYPQTDLVKKE